MPPCRKTAISYNGQLQQRRNSSNSNSIKRQCSSLSSHHNTTTTTACYAPSTSISKAVLVPCYAPSNHLSPQQTTYTSRGGSASVSQHSSSSSSTGAMAVVVTACYAPTIPGQKALLNSTWALFPRPGPRTAPVTSLLAYSSAGATESPPAAAAAATIPVSHGRINYGHAQQQQQGTEGKQAEQQEWHNLKSSRQLVKRKSRGLVKAVVGGCKRMSLISVCNAGALYGNPFYGYCLKHYMGK